MVNSKQKGARGMTWPTATVCVAGIIALAWIIESIGLGHANAYTKGYRDAIEDSNLIAIGFEKGRKSIKDRR